MPGHQLDNRGNSRQNTITIIFCLYGDLCQAVHLESGAYPQTLDAGVDAFSPTLAPLFYKSAGDSYVLYSVGPDGKDESGAEIQTLRINQEPGAKTVSDRLTPDSFGDIVAPVL